MPRWQRRWGVLCTTVSVSTCVPLAMSSSAQAAPRPNPKVQQLLDYIKKHPMSLQSIPMEYEAQPYAPLPDVIQGLEAKDVLPAGSSAPSTQHMDAVVAGLLYVACGGLDQAHNLVTPLCWGSYTTYGGKPIAGSPSAKDAAYVHALVHLREGAMDGEFGSGYSNANYWYAAAGQHEIHPALLRMAQQLAAGNAALEKFVANHGSSWGTSRFVSLCQQATDSKDADVVKFCEKVMAAEWQLLFDSCHSKL